MDHVRRMQALLYYANSAKVARGLTLQGYPVSGPTVSRWAKGQNITPRAVQLVETLLGTAKEAAPPTWAERLLRTVDAIAERVGVSLEERAAASAADRIRPQPPNVGSAADQGADSLAGVPPLGRRDQ